MKTIINVQFMRAVAALAVLWYHFSLQLNIIQDGGDWFFNLFNQLGYGGVDFFFVISGYIMWVTTETLPSHQPVSTFAYKRLTRIYLGYWPYFLLGLLIIAVYPHLTSANTNLWGSFWLTEPHTNQLLIPVAWTLQFELYFYAWFTGLLLLPRHTMLAVIKTLFVGLLALHLYQVLAGAHSLDLAPWLSRFVASPFCLEFLSGCLMGAFFQQHRLKWLSLAVALGVGLLVLIVFIQQQVIQSSLIHGQYDFVRVLLFGSSAWLLLAAVVEAELRGRVLMQRLSLLLGGASYSIYLSHTLVIALVYAMGWQLWLSENSDFPVLWLWLIITATVIYSVLHYQWIERPLMQVAHRLRIKLLSQSPKTG